MGGGSLCPLVKYLYKKKLTIPRDPAAVKRRYMKGGGGGGGVGGGGGGGGGGGRGEGKRRGERKEREEGRRE